MKTHKNIILLFIFIFLNNLAWGQEVSPTKTLYLKDGSFLLGHLILEREHSYHWELTDGTQIILQKDQVRVIEEQRFNYYHLKNGKIKRSKGFFTSLMIGGFIEKKVNEWVEPQISPSINVAVGYQLNNKLAVGVGTGYDAYDVSMIPLYLNFHGDLLNSGVNFRRILNPDTNGNPSDYVATYTRNAGEMTDVIVGRFDGNLSLDPTSTITMDVWDPTAPTDILVSLQNENQEVILEMTATTSTSSSWQTLTFDPTPVVDAMDISRFAILFDPNTENSDQYFWDNFQLNGVTAITDLEAVTDFQASPNPTQGETLFQYNLKTAANVNLSVFDMNGKLVDRIISENQAAGAHQATWIANDLPNGIYFYNMLIDGATASGKIILSK